MPRERVHPRRDEVLQAYQKTGLRPTHGFACDVGPDGEGFLGCAIGAMALAGGISNDYREPNGAIGTFEATHFLRDERHEDEDFLRGITYGFDTVFYEAERGTPLPTIRASMLRMVKRGFRDEGATYLDGFFLGSDVAYALLRQREKEQA